MVDNLIVGRHYFFITCVNCGTDIAFKDAPSPQEDEAPMVQGVKIVCPNCQTERSYPPSEVYLGKYEGE